MIRTRFLTVALVCGALSSSFATADSLDIKIGQMLLIGTPGTTMDSTVLQAVRNGRVGSVIFFEKNIPPANSFQGLKKITWAYQSAAAVPLLICIDQEGGRVNRLKPKYGFTRSLSAAQLGKYQSIDSVRFYAEATAATLRGLGFNVNFAPVVDLAINPTNPIVAGVERSYSAREDSVTWFAAEVIRQHRKLGIITALKHFPGHGSSKDDTHLGLTDVTQTWEERELGPYVSLLKDGLVDAVMTTHIVNRKLDEKMLPGTLSHSIIDGILRKRIGYDGVVFSDDMQMQAIAKYYGVEESIKLAINAGVDILCFSNNQGSAVRAADRLHAIIRTYVEKGEISKERIDQSYQRIMALKSKLYTTDTRAMELQVASALAEVERLRAELEKVKGEKPKEDARPNLPEEEKSRKKKRK